MSIVLKLQNKGLEKAKGTVNGFAHTKEGHTILKLILNLMSWFAKLRAVLNDVCKKLTEFSASHAVALIRVT